MSSESFATNGVGDTLVEHAKSKLAVPIRSIYQDQPTVLIFLRRWGCQLCRGYAKKLTIELAPTLKANNVRLSAIGLEHLGIEEFIEGNYFDSNELFIDDGKKAYQKLGLQHVSLVTGLGQLLSSKTRDWNKEVKSMGVSGNLKGDGMQMGGSYVLSSNGDVWFAHRQTNFGDHPAVDDILAALSKNIPAFSATDKASTQETATSGSTANSCSTTDC